MTGFDQLSGPFRLFLFPTNKKAKTFFKKYRTEIAASSSISVRHPAQAFLARSLRCHLTSPKTPTATRKHDCAHFYFRFHHVALLMLAKGEQVRLQIEISFVERILTFVTARLLPYKSTPPFASPTETLFRLLLPLDDRV
jgi:hypothetical protein